MVIVLSIVGAVIWFAFVYLLMYAKQSPEAQVRRRLHLLIEQAEKERARKLSSKLAKNSVQKSVEILPEEIVVDKNSFSYRVIWPFIHGIEERLRKLAPAQIGSMLEDRIFRAGKQGIWSVNRLVLFWLISLATGIAIALLFVEKSNLAVSQEIIIMIIGAIAGAALPFLILNSKIQQRQRDIRRQLPEFLDLLCVSVQAGLSFDGAVAKIATRMKGPLITEFKRMQSDVSLGMTRQYSLTQMAKRCDLEEVYLFTSSIIQAEKLGTSMSRTLKLQSDNMRDRHRQYVRAEAMKAPVKIIFPMVLFIFPSIFVVLLFPAILTLLKTLAK